MQPGTADATSPRRYGEPAALRADDPEREPGYPGRSLSQVDVLDDLLAERCDDPDGVGRDRNEEPGRQQIPGLHRVGAVVRLEGTVRTTA